MTRGQGGIDTRHLSLFSGIGGIDLAAHWASIETVAFCEREPFPRRVLAHHWPGIPIYDDVCTLTKEVLLQDGIIGPDRAIDIISAGYPCQPFSNAGQRRGQEDDRHLWPYVIRLIKDIRPRWFVGENVAGHITLGLDDVLTDLADAGYTAQAFVIPAAAVYGSHRRDRVFIVGYSERCGCDREPRRGTNQESPYGHIRVKRGAERAVEPGLGRSPDVLPTWMDGRGVNPLDSLADYISSYPQPALMGQPQHGWEPPRVATGIRNRTARLKALGNAVNPLQIYPIMAAIKAINDQLEG